ncbi:MAG: sigma-70 family RNA polymerase sigma factor [Ruminococcaceae bacterium]|nr:sigma-70 family RNA polymerase sigma factor [Oscillospiraceae bacterium]
MTNFDIRGNINICISNFNKGMIILLIFLLDLIDEEDKEKFKIVYEKYVNLVRYISLQKLGNQAIADESAQEAWISIARNFKKVGDPYDAKTKNYIATIANSWANKVYNRELKEKSIEYSDDILTDFSDMEYFERIQTSELASVISNLPERQKMYLYLSYSYGYTSKEIAKIHKVSDASVRKTIQFAKARIRQELDNKEGQ